MAAAAPPPGFTVLDAMHHPDLFGAAFSGPSWGAWRTILKAAFALPMTREELATFRGMAGDRDPPGKQCKELWIVGGRRGGKDSVASLIAAYTAAFCDFRGALRPGERAAVMCLAVGRVQARIVLGYIKGYFVNNPLLAPLIERETREGLELSTGAEIIVSTADYRAVRGRTIACAVLDECSFWQDDRSVSPDVETYNALVPGMATLSNAMLVAISTPYRRSGLLYEKYRASFGKPDDDVLVIQAPSRVLNPLLDQSIIDREMEADPARASAEWLGEFRNDVGAFVAREVLDSCTIAGRYELAPSHRFTYHAFADAAGGSGSDSFTLAICHAEDRDGQRIGVVDAIREKTPPFSPDDTTREYAQLLKAYNCREVRSDKWGGDWVAERFRTYGIRSEPAEKTKSDLYKELLPILNSGRCELLDHRKLYTQLAGLERRTARGGKDSIDHSPNAHDDIANAVAGALGRVVTKRQPMYISPETLARARALTPSRQRVFF